MNWTVLKALHQIYETGQTSVRQTVISDPDIRFMIDSTGELMTTRKILFDPDHRSLASSFRMTYEQRHLDRYRSYLQFLQENGFNKPQTRWSEEEVRVLMQIKQGMDDGNLNDLRQQIIACNETVRGVSLMFFKHDKYLDNRESLVHALKQILDVSEFADDRDRQYIYKLQCRNPKLIVVCENIYFLTMPTLPRKHSIELWYVGGSNTAMLEFADSRGLPIYYSCDWDQDGLEIYSRVKRWIPDIKLLLPIGQPRSIKNTEHKSHWTSNSAKRISNLEESLFTETEREFIETLVRDDCWVVEESNKLIEMLAINGITISPSVHDT